ncbi:MAG TPA: c-type cytochrome [Albitalea sp.]|nr:c-type cytochrome [Albitalea sp.]
MGRPATPKELAAWDIDVRPDFKGLPKGSGSVAAGQQVWEARCASCHGIFGESGEVFNPIVGGTTAADVKSGHVARLLDRAYPGRTTLMKASTLSTLWDYINRAMPWNAPKSLSTDEVYAVTAYLLNLGGVLPDDFVLSERTIADAQKLLPNRNGMTTQHALWPGKGFAGTVRPDVQGSSCMSRCAGEPQVASFLPDFARNAHGNLAEQNRSVGPQRGIDTSTPKAAAVPATAPAPNPAIALTQKYTCVACHGIAQGIVGPAFQDVARKHGARPDAVAYLAAKIKSGGSGVWGAIPMPEQTLPDADAKAIAQWLAAGASP